MTPEILFEYVVSVVTGIFVGIGLGGFVLCFFVFIAYAAFGWLLND
jgi:hypothetical protein